MYYRVYQAKCLVNNKLYIGRESSAKPFKRKREHLYQATRANSNKPFHVAIREFGKENFEWSVIKECETIQECIKLEDHLIHELNTFIPNGYNAIASPGGKPFWTLDKLLQEANKYTTSKEWENNSKGSYVAAVRAGVLPECTAHMIKNFIFWDQNSILQEAMKYKNSKEWRNQNPKSYDAAKSRGILDKIYQHIDKIYKNDYTIEYFKEICTSYEYIGDLMKDHPTLYSWAFNNKISFQEFGLKSARGARSCKYPQIFCPQTNETYNGPKEVAEKLKVDLSGVFKVLKGKLKTIKGYTLIAQPDEHTK